jgi:hypothetical protein
MEEKTKSLQDAQDAMEELFAEGGFFDAVPRNDYERYSGDSISRPKAAEMATAFCDIMELLAEFPALASKEFCDYRYSVEEEDLRYMYPLELFVWNSFGAKVLNQVFSFYPPASSRLIKNYVRQLTEVISEETLLWVLHHCREDGPFRHTYSLPLLQVLLNRFRRSRYRAQEWLPTQVIHAILESRPYDQVPVSDLFRDDYSEESLLLAVDAHARREDSLVLRDCWTMKPMYARVLATVLPIMKELHISRGIDYTVDGWNVMMESLQTCHNLESVQLALKSSWLSSDPTIIVALRSYLHNKASRTRLQLDWKGDSETSETNSLLLSELLEGFEEVPTSDPVISSLILDGFHDIPGNQLQLLTDIAKELSLRDCSVALNNANDMESRTAGKRNGFTPNLWRSICEVSRDTTWNLIGPLQMINFGLELASGEFPDRKDVTKLVVQLLECPCLWSICICSKFTGCWAVESGRICEALANNHSLFMLRLVELEIQHDNPNIIPSMLAQVLEGPNTTLASLDILDGPNLYTLTDEASRGSRYVDYNSSLKVQYLLDLNARGRARLRSKTATAADVVDTLDAAMRIASFHATRLVPIMNYLVPDDYDGTELDQLNKTFEHLMDHVNKWSTAPLHKHTSDTQSVLYGILRESPGLWCA